MGKIDDIVEKSMALMSVTGLLFVWRAGHYFAGIAENEEQAEAVLSMALERCTHAFSEMQEKLPDPDVLSVYSLAVDRIAHALKLTTLREDVDGFLTGFVGDHPEFVELVDEERLSWLQG